MSLEKKDSDLDQSVCRPKSVEEAVGSHYALQVALQTMKERCQHLQQRLAAVEEENLNLRIEYRKRKSDSACATAEDASESEPEDSKLKIDCLEEKVAMLTRQKSQLTHHLFMVATENRQLWNRLSNLTQANQNLGSHLSKISSTLNRHHSTNSIVVPKSQLPASSLSHRGELNLSSDNVLTKGRYNVANKGTEVSEESLEEISLKLIKSFLQEKTELEEQYAQMVEIQSDSSLYSVQNLGYAYMEDGNETIEDMKDHHKKLVELKAMLKGQQTMMMAAIANVERIKKVTGCAVRKPCQEKSEVKQTLKDSDADIEAEVESLRKWGVPDGTTYSEVIQRQLDQVAEPPSTTSSMTTSSKYKEHICPMCGKLYNQGIPFEMFQQHVSDHFTEEEEEEESYSIVTNPEVTT